MPYHPECHCKESALLLLNIPKCPRDPGMPLQSRAELYYCWTSQNALPSWMPLQRARSTIAEHPKMPYHPECHCKETRSTIAEHPKMPYHPECHCKELALLLLNIPKCPTILNATAKSSLYYCWTSQNALPSWMPLQRARSTIAEHPKMPYHPECHCKESSLYYCWTSQNALPSWMPLQSRLALLLQWTSQNALPSWMPLQRARSTIAEHPKMPYHPECHCKELALLLLNIPKCPSILNATAKRALCSGIQDGRAFWDVQQ